MDYGFIKIILKLLKSFNFKIYILLKFQIGAYYGFFYPILKIYKNPFKS